MSKKTKYRWDDDDYYNDEDRSKNKKAERREKKRLKNAERNDNLPTSQYDYDYRQDD